MVLHSKKQLGRKKQEVDPNSGYGGKNAQKLKHVTKNYPNNKIMDAFDFFFVSTSFLSFKKMFSSFLARQDPDQPCGMILDLDPYGAQCGSRLRIRIRTFADS